MSRSAEQRESQYNAQNYSSVHIAPMPMAPPKIPTTTIPLGATLPYTGNPVVNGVGTYPQQYACPPQPLQQPPPLSGPPPLPTTAPPPPTAPPPSQVVATSASSQQTGDPAALYALQQQQYALAMQQYQYQQAAVQAPQSIHGNDDQDIEDDSKGRFPINGNDETYNLNVLLRQNILESDYFRALYQLRTYHEVIDEIYKRVPHVGPWQAGTSRIPSTAYCLLYKCMVMRLTYNQLRGLLNTNDSPYVRAIGLLYLRYCCPPKDMWNWYEPLLEDEEEFQPSPDPNLRMTIGEYAIKLLTDMKYYDTTLPRIPVPIERKFKVLLLLLSEKQKRRRGNMRSHEKGLLVAGTKVRAIYSDEENEPAWYDAVIESQENDGNIPKYWVNFPEYGNQSLVDLGEIEIPRERSKSRSKSDRGSSDSRSRRSRSRSRSRDRDRHHRRSRSRSRDRDRDRDVGCSDDLLAKVLQGERNNSTAVGKDYGRRPASYKGSLALKQDRFTARRRSRSRTPPRSDYRRRDRSRSRDRDRKSSKSDSTSNTTTQVSAAQLEKMKKLKEMYGDASASK